jgi:MFS family permease
LGTVVILGLASGGQLPLVGAIISARFGPAAFGTVMGLFYLCIRPVALAAPLAGWLRDTFGSYDYLFLGGLVVALLCAPAMLGVMAPSRPAAGKRPAG